MCVYGQSSIYSTHGDYALEHSVQDMLDLLVLPAATAPPELAILDGADREFFLGHLAGEAANVPALDDGTRRGCLISRNASLGEHFLGGDPTAHDFSRLRSLDAHRERDDVGGQRRFIIRPPRGLAPWVDRCWPRTRHARRSDTPSSATT